MWTPCLAVVEKTEVQGGWITAWGSSLLLRPASCMFRCCQGGGSGDGVSDVTGVGSGSNMANVYRTNSFNPLSITFAFGQGCKEYSPCLRPPSINRPAVIVSVCTVPYVCESCKSPVGELSSKQPPSTLIHSCLQRTDLLMSSCLQLSIVKVLIFVAAETWSVSGSLVYSPGRPDRVLKPINFPIRCVPGAALTS
jgi:hypothetical protein